MRGIKLVILFVVVFLSPYSFKGMVRDSIIKDKSWSILSNYNKTSDLKWVAVSKKYEDSNDSIFIFNTDSSKSFLSLKSIKNDFIGNKHYVSLKKDGIEILNLETGTRDFIEDVLTYIVLDNKYIWLEKENNKYEIVNTLGQKKWKNENIKFLKKPSDESAFYYEKKDHATHFVRVDLLSFTDEEILQIDGSLSIQEFITSDNNIILKIWDGVITSVYYFDSDSKNFEKIPFPKGIVLNNIQMSFFLKDNVYFQTIFHQDQNIDFSSYLDLWSTSDKYLSEKNSTNGKKIIFRQFVFNISNKQLFDATLDNLQYAYLINEKMPFSLKFNIEKHQNYNKVMPDVDIYLHNLLTDEKTLVVDSLVHATSNFSISDKGNYIAYKKNNTWFVLNVITGAVIELITDERQKELYWEEKEQNVFLVTEGGLWRMSLIGDERIKIFTHDSSTVSSTVLNGKISKPKVYSSFTGKAIYIDESKPIGVQVFYKDNSSSVFSINNAELKLLVKKSNTKKTNLFLNEDILLFIEENFNIPPKLKKLKKGKVTTIYDPKVPKEVYSFYKQDIVDFTNSEGVTLKGILYYPKDFDPKKKYPLIVSIYQRRYFEATTFLYPSYTTTIGFNIPISNRKGYFVYLPDIVYDKRGTGLSALDCVEQGLDALLKENKSIDPDRIGLHGHSHGGYETNFIVTQTNRFAAAVSGAGNSDIVHSYFSYNYNFRTPFFFQYENGQYEMNVPFAEDKELYLKNSPIMFVDQVTTPILTWTGVLDENIHWEQTRTFFIGLLRNKVPHIALFYKNEGHTLLNSRNQNDLVSRTLDWFDYFLKNNRNHNWINNNLN